MPATITRREVNAALIAGAVALAVPGGAARARGAAVPLYDFCIAGGVHHNLFAARDGLVPGTRLVLRPEPENPHDAFAIAVERADGLMLGYIPRAANEPIVRLLRDGATVVAEVVGPVDIWDDEAVEGLVHTGIWEGDPVVRLTLYA